MQSWVVAGLNYCSPHLFMWLPFSTHVSTLPQSFGYPPPLKPHLFRNGGSVSHSRACLGRSASSARKEIISALFLPASTVRHDSGWGEGKTDGLCLFPKLNHPSHLQFSPQKLSQVHSVQCGLTIKQIRLRTPPAKRESWSCMWDGERCWGAVKPPAQDRDREQ